MRGAAPGLLLAAAGLVLAFVSVAVTGCDRGAASNAELERINLPGFSIGVLPGKVESTSDAPSDGRHLIRLRKPRLTESLFGKVAKTGAMIVTWSSQSYTREDWKSIMLPTFLQSIAGPAKSGGRVLKEAELDDARWLYVIGTPDVPLGLGIVNCDAAFSVAVVVGHVRDVELQFAELERIVKSVRCEVKAANRVRPLAATRLPQKFGRTPEHAYQIFESLDGEQLIVNFTTTDVQRDPVMYRRVLLAMLSEEIGPGVTESQIERMPEGSPRPAGKSSLMRVPMPESGGKIYVGTQYCPEIDLSLISVWAVHGATDELARERQSQLGCPGEATTPVPDFSVLAEAACREGDKEFCGLAELPQ